MNASPLLLLRSRSTSRMTTGVVSSSSKGENSRVGDAHTSLTDCRRAPHALQRTQTPDLEVCICRGEEKWQSLIGWSKFLVWVGKRHQIGVREPKASDSKCYFVRCRCWSTRRAIYGSLLLPDQCPAASNSMPRCENFDRSIQSRWQLRKGRIESDDTPRRALPLRPHNTATSSRRGRRLGQMALPDRNMVVWRCPRPRGLHGKTRRVNVCLRLPVGPKPGIARTGSPPGPQESSVPSRWLAGWRSSLTFLSVPALVVDPLPITISSNFASLPPRYVAMHMGTHVPFSSQDYRRQSGKMLYSLLGESIRKCTRLVDDDARPPRSTRPPRN